MSHNSANLFSLYFYSWPETRILSDVYLPRFGCKATKLHATPKIMWFKDYRGISQSISSAFGRRN